MTYWLLFLVQTLWAQDVTGITALSITERVATFPPSFVESRWAAAVSPAPYGHGVLTSSSLAAYLPQLATTARLTGMSGGGWTDVVLTVNRCWQLTPSWRVTPQLQGGWKGASGFEGDAWASLDLSAQMMMDPTWFVGFGIDGILQAHTHFAPPDRVLHLGVAWQGAVAAAAEVAVWPSRGSALLLTALLRLTDQLLVRGSIATNPIAARVAMQIALPTLPLLTAECEAVERLGVRARVMVDVLLDE